MESEKSAAVKEVAAQFEHRSDQIERVCEESDQALIQRAASWTEAINAWEKEAIKQLRVYAATKLKVTSIDESRLIHSRQTLQLCTKSDKRMPGSKSCTNTQKLIHPALFTMQSLQTITASPFSFQTVVFRPRSIYPISIDQNPSIASADAASSKIVYSYLEPINRDIHSIPLAEMTDIEFEWASSNTMQIESLAVDPIDGFIYITESRQGTIFILNPNLERVDEIPRSADTFDWTDPRGIAVSPDGIRVAVCDSSGNCVFVMERLSKKFLHRIGDANHEKGSSPGLLNQPMNCTFDLNGNLYVAEAGNNWIQKFDADYNHVMFINSYGKEGEQTAVCSVAVLDDDVLVSSGENGDYIQFHTLDGKLLKEVDGPGNPQGFMLPENNICRGPDGGFVLTDVWHDKVYLYGKDGDLLYDMVCPYPVGASFDLQGNLLVVLSRLCAIKKYGN